MRAMLGLNLALAAALALPMAVRAEEAAKAAEAAKPAEAAAAPAEKKEMAAVEKNDAPGSLSKGNAMMGEGKYEEAAAYFEGIGEQTTANGLKKREPWRLVGLSTSLVHSGQYEKAAEVAQKLTEAYPAIPAGWNNLGAALGNQGKRQEAIDALTKGVEALKAAGADSSKTEANLAELQKAVEEGMAKKKGAKG